MRLVVVDMLGRERWRISLLVELNKVIWSRKGLRGRDKNTEKGKIKKLMKELVRRGYAEVVSCSNNTLMLGNVFPSSTGVSNYVTCM